MSTSGVRGKALAAAFPHTIPILTGFGFLGFTYGIYMNVSGFPFWYATAISLIVFGGSLQFVMVELLLSVFSPVAAFLMAVMLQARHLFYGVAMLDKFKAMGWKKFYLIFGLCDETFSINCSTTVPQGVDRGWFYFFVTLLDQSYWVVATALGGLAGSVIPFDTEGLDFVMTAMFVVILLEQLLKETRHDTAAIGAVCSVGCLLLFGPDSFLIPAMACILALLSLLRKPIEPSLEGGGAA